MIDDLFYNPLDCLWRGYRDSVQDLDPEGAPRWLRVRLGPVHACYAFAVVAAECVFFVAD